LAESLKINRELKDQTAIAYVLEDCAGLAAARGHAAFALRLAGVSETLRQTIGAPLPPTEQARVDRLLTPACRILSEAAQAAAWSAGRAMTLEQAIEDALAGMDQAFEPNPNR
jgi:hypothetical protein